MNLARVNLGGLISAAVLSLTLVAAAPVYAQDQHEKQEEKAKPEVKKAQSAEKKAQGEKSAKPEDKGAQQTRNNKQEEKTAQEHAQQAKPEQHAERAASNEGHRIPQDRYKANFGREHTFHVSQSEYNGGRRFQYGGYWFGFQDAWPSNWLYTQDVFVVEINGMYYLCNPSYPGVNIALNITM